MLVKSFLTPSQNYAPKFVFTYSYIHFYKFSGKRTLITISFWKLLRLSKGWGKLSNMEPRNIFLHSLWFSIKWLSILWKWSKPESLLISVYVHTHLPAGIQLVGFTGTDKLSFAHVAKKLISSFLIIKLFSMILQTKMNENSNRC